LRCRRSMICRSMSATFCTTPFASGIRISLRPPIWGACACLRWIFFSLEDTIRHTREADWLHGSTITELHLCVFDGDLSVDHTLRLELNHIREKMSRSLEVLCFSVDVSATARKMVPFVLDSMLNDPVWEDLSSLRSLMMRVVNGTPVDDKLSRFIEDNLPEVRCILHDEFRPGSGLNTNIRHVDFFGKVFRLVEGEWSEGAS